MKVLKNEAFTLEIANISPYLQHEQKLCLLSEVWTKKEANQQQAPSTGVCSHATAFGESRNPEIQLRKLKRQKAH